MSIYIYILREFYTAINYSRIDGQWVKLEGKGQDDYNYYSARLRECGQLSVERE